MIIYLNAGDSNSPFLFCKSVHDMQKTVGMTLKEELQSFV
ncbi:hypothetical protein M2479_000623 [Breznakia sp. PH5-24]|nr:hypothetical protein [Breznakia sp. PH5-24]